jgi:hypothetical protein
MSGRHPGTGGLLVWDRLPALMAHRPAATQAAGRIREAPTVAGPLRGANHRMGDVS